MYAKKGLKDLKSDKEIIDEIAESSNLFIPQKESVEKIVSGVKLKGDRVIALNLVSDNLTDIPDSIGKLADLRKLTIKSNRLVEIPESIKQLVALREFTIYANNLTVIPESIGQLLGLRRHNY